MMPGRGGMCHCQYKSIGTDHHPAERGAVLLSAQAVDAIHLDGCRQCAIDDGTGDRALRDFIGLCKAVDQTAADQ